MLIVRDNRPERLDELTRTLERIVLQGAREMLLQALEAEVELYLERHRHERDARGHALVVRNGRARRRKIFLGHGSVEIAAPRVDDRRLSEDGRRRRFTSRILPPYARRATTLIDALPLLYLRALSDGGRSLALAGDVAGDLEPALAERIGEAWRAACRRFASSDLSRRDDLYLRPGGIHLRHRSDRQHLLVVIGIGTGGEEELIAAGAGEPDSVDCWSRLLRRLRDRGLQPPAAAVGDPSLGFWAAARGIWPETEPSRFPSERLTWLRDRLPPSLRPQLDEALAAERRRQQARDSALLAGWKTGQSHRPPAGSDWE
ncbi:MAG: hypothetical protein D6696_04510 [Acidobacteria bacterium]|nr:MAG: hypothetical protein D6696_04510 [Acidobacteriota bacterium]